MTRPSWLCVRTYHDELVRGDQTIKVRVAEARANVSTSTPPGSHKLAVRLRALDGDSDGLGPAARWAAGPTWVACAYESDRHPDGGMEKGSALDRS